MAANDVWMSESFSPSFNRFVQMADSFRNQASDYRLYEWVTESLTHLIRSNTWIHSVTKHLPCVLGDTQRFCCGFDWNYFHQQNWAKQSILCLKCKSLNFNFLLIELLLYKITLQSCWNILVIFFYYRSMHL